MVYSPAHERTDSDLVATVLRGDSSAFDLLVHRHHGAVFAIALARLHDRDAADDMAQEAFIRAYLHLDKLTEPSRFLPWICRIARNSAADWHRRQRVADRLLPRVSSEVLTVEVADTKAGNPRDDAARSQEHAALLRAIQSLPPEQREVLLLHYTQGMNPREIGELTGLHRTTVRYHLVRALRTMRQRLQPLLLDRSPSPASVASCTRTIQAVGAIAALGAQTKAALAAETATEVHAATTSLSAAPVPALFKALAFGGATTMGAGKTAALAASIILLTATGGYVATHPETLPQALRPDVIISPTKPESDGSFSAGTAIKVKGAGGGGDTEMRNIQLRQLISTVHGVTPARLVEVDALPSATYNVLLKGAPREPEARQKVLDKIEKQFGYSVSLQRKMSEVLLLKQANAQRSPTLQEASGPGSLSFKPGEMVAKASSLDSLQTLLEGHSGKPVLDETGLSGKFNFTLNWDEQEPRSIVQAVRKIGLQLEPATREIEVVIVKKIKPGAAD